MALLQYPNYGGTPKSNMLKRNSFPCLNNKSIRTEFSSSLHWETKSFSNPIFSNVLSDFENILVSIKFLRSAILTRRFFSLARRPVDAVSSFRGCENGSSAGVSEWHGLRLRIIFTSWIYIRKITCYQRRYRLIGYFNKIFGYWATRWTVSTVSAWSLIYRYLNVWYW